MAQREMISFEQEEAGGSTPPTSDPDLIFAAQPEPKKVAMEQETPVDHADGGLVPLKIVEEKRGSESVEEEKPPRPKPSAIIKLFRYATALDWLLMAVGTFAAICHGASLPVLMLLFGKLTNAFTNEAISSALANGLFANSSDVSCSQVFQFAPNQSIPFPDASGGVSSCTVPGNLTFDELIRVCVSDQAQCLTESDFIAEINRLVYIFVGVGAGVFIAATIQISFFQTACERQVHKIRLYFYRAILRQEIGWFDANPSGELASRLTDDMGKIHDGIGDKVALFIQWITTFFGGFIIGFVEEWRLTLLLCAFVPFLAIAGAIMVKFIATFTSEEQKEYASAGAVAEEVLSSIKTVVAFSGEAKERERYDSRLKEARLLGAKKGFTVGITFFVTFFLFFAVDAAAFWFGGYLISEEISQSGNVLTVFFAVLIGAFSLGQAFPNLENLTTAAGAAGAIFETIDRVPLIDASSDEGDIPDRFDSTVEFKNISFLYPTRPDVQVLNDLSLRVEVGQTMALVGPSGCGKSTLVQLLQRFYDPDSGEILVGGRDIRSLNLKWLRENIGLVSQEPVLFDTTIAENIRFGKQDATLDEIIEAASSANAHNFISELPDGYNTQVGEGGAQMSGGQKQRIAIARALVRDPKILLLDEATSALDTESESIVQAALDHAREGRTTIVIAHRLSTIQNADVIASIENGEVVEMGTHSELMDLEGLYYELVTAQSFGADELFIKGAVHSLSGKRSTRRHISDRTSESASGVQRQISIQRQSSHTADDKAELKKVLSKKELEKELEELDKEIPAVGLWRIMKLNSREWWIIVIGLIGSAISGCVWPGFAVLLGEVLAVFARPASEILSAVHLWAGLFIVLGIVSGGGQFAKAVCFSVSGENLTSRLRSKAFKAMLRQEMGWFDNERNSTGALTTRLANDASLVQGATGTRLGTLLETMFGMIVALVIAFVYSWVLSLVILGLVPIMIIAGLLEVKALSGHAASNRMAFEDAGKIAVESIENVRTVASLGVETSFYVRYHDHVKHPYRKALFNTVVYGLTYAFSQTMLYFMYAVVFRFGAFQVTLDESNIAHESFEDIFRVFTALIFGAVAAGQAGAFAPNYTKARLAANRVFFLLDRKPEIDGYSKEGSKLDKVCGDISVEDVVFRYPARPEVTVLNELSVSVKQGQTLALVGPSGCGKSTVVSLIERFYDPLGGRLALDQVDTRDLNIQWLRSQIGIVSQEPVLFDTSIAGNIRYGANFRDVSDDEVIEAAKAANIHSFIESLPQGYGTNVGAKGTQLSGGQKQRIAIARALVRDPKILLLDEATSALDTESEKIVQEALDRAREGRTSIVIAHRLSTIYNADCIAVIKGGKVVEVGTHTQLLEKKGTYYKLNRYQILAADEERAQHE